MQHNIFYAEILVHFAIITRKLGLLVDSERVCAFVDRFRDRNSKCRLIEVGVWGGTPRGKGVWGQSPQRLAIFIIFQ